MKKFSLSLLFGFIVNNVVGALVANFILSPITLDMMNGTSRAQDALEMIPLLGGYFILTLLMVIAYPFLSIKGSWFKKGTLLGLFSGGMAFVSGYLVVSGWAIIPPLPMLISGIVDSSSTVATGIVIAFFYRSNTKS